MRLHRGIPEQAVEQALLEGTGGSGALERLEPVGGPDTWREARASLDAVHVAPEVRAYLLEIVGVLRRLPGGALSPRAALTLQAVARAHVGLCGRDFVTPDDVKTAAPAVITHRLPTGGDDGSTAERVVASALEQVATPVGTASPRP